MGETDRYNDLKKMYKPLTKWWEKNAGKAGVPINKVEVSRRLVDSPAVVLATEYGMSARQERINKVQDQAPTYFSEQQKVLEINANHPTIYDMLQKVQADESDLPEEPAKVEDDDDEDDEEDGADEEEA